MDKDNSQYKIDFQNVYQNEKFKLYLKNNQIPFHTSETSQLEIYSEFLRSSDMPHVKKSSQSFVNQKDQTNIIIYENENSSQYPENIL